MAGMISVGVSIVQIARGGTLRAPDGYRFAQDESGRLVVDADGRYLIVKI